MKVLFDHQAFANQPVGGVSRVFREIIEGLARLEPGWSLSLFAPMHRSRLLPELKRDRPPNLSIGPAVRRPPGAFGFGKLSRQINPRLLRTYAARLRPDVFYPTWYDRRCEIWPDGRTGTVVVVHDMIQEKFPRFFPDHAEAIGAKRHFITRADIIVTVSQNTRADLLEFFPKIDPSRIIVAPLATRLRPPAGPTAPGRPFLLYVGQRAGYKNFARLAEAFAASATLRKEFQLVCFGGNRPGRSEWRELRGLGLREGDVRFATGGDDDLARHYAQASAFLYPSLYEGFGIPLLEAMACGTPVVASRAGSIPEVAGGAAAYFDPEDAEDIGNAIEKVVFDAEVSAALVEAGKRRESEFTWETSCRRHRDACLLAGPSLHRRGRHHSTRPRGAGTISDPIQSPLAAKRQDRERNLPAAI